MANPSLYASARSHFDFDPATEDTDAYANDVAGTSGVAFVLAATAAGDSLAHKVIITPSGSVTGNYTLTGTDADGRAQTETLATDTTNAVTSAKYYLTCTEVLAPAGIGSETVDIGFVDEFVSGTIPLNSESVAAAVVAVEQSGTINWTIQVTTQDPMKRGLSAPFDFDDQNDLYWLDDANFTAKAASVGNKLAVHGMAAMRFKANSYSAAAEIQLYVTTQE